MREGSEIMHASHMLARIRTHNPARRCTRKQYQPCIRLHTAMLLAAWIESLPHTDSQLSVFLLSAFCFYCLRALANRPSQ